MITEQQQGRASLYAVGALTADEQRAFEAELCGNAELRDFARSLQRTSGLLALALPRAVPPRELRDKVLRRIEARSRRGEEAERAGAAPSHPAPARPPGFLFHGADDPMGWKELPVRGAWIKLLSLERERGYAVLLGRLEAGVRYPAHTHEGSEDLYIITGDLHLGDRKLGPGDFHHSDSGTAHGVNHSVEGCTLLAVLPVKHELVQFAMAGT
jgi:quercetin dioxygenase-like cupin family protein